MILRLFRSNHPALALWLPVIGIILWLPGLWLNQPPDFSMALIGVGPLDQPWSADVGTGIAFILLLAGALIFNHLFQQYELIERKNQLPGLCYIIAFSWSPFLLQYSHLLVGQLFVLLAIRRLMQVYRQPNVLRELYDTGMFVALAALFYLPFLLLLAGCLLSVGILRAFNGREWLMPLSGMATIALVFFSLNYIFDWQAINQLKLYWYPAQNVMPVGLFDWFKYMIAFILLLMTLVAAPSFVAALTRSTMRDRNLKLILLVFGFNTVGLYFMFLLLPDFGSNVLLLAFPVALMLVYAVADKRVNWMISGLFYALIAAAIINNYGMLAVE